MTVLNKAFADVHLFHITFDHPTSDIPRMQPIERALARADWLIEEANELKDATTIFEQADAYIDSIYFAIGGLVDMGINPSPIWELVQAANMAKLQPDGTVARREDGKIIKPTGWIAPDALIEAEIQRQIDECDL